VPACCMTPPEGVIRVRHPWEAAEKAIHYSHGRIRQDLDDDKLLRLALTKLVEIVGEAVKQASESTRSANPSVPWAAAARMRDRLVHHYFDIDLDVLRATVAHDLPELLAALPGEADEAEPADRDSGTRHCLPALTSARRRSCSSRTATSIFHRVPSRTWGMECSRMNWRRVGQDTPTYSAASSPDSQTVGAGRASRSARACPARLRRLAQAVVGVSTSSTSTRLAAPSVFSRLAVCPTVASSLSFSVT
jgi:uncharacterized protein with HEPN domain